MINKKIAMITTIIFALLGCNNDEINYLKNIEYYQQDSIRKKIKCIYKNSDSFRLFNDGMWRILFRRDSVDFHFFDNEIISVSDIFLLQQAYLSDSLTYMQKELLYNDSVFNSFEMKVEGISCDISGYIYADIILNNISGKDIDRLSLRYGNSPTKKIVKTEFLYTSDSIGSNQTDTLRLLLAADKSDISRIFFLYIRPISVEFKDKTILYTELTYDKMKYSEFEIDLFEYLE